MATGIRVGAAAGADARSRLLAELASGPARRGYGIAYDLLGNRAEAEEAVQEGLARACENIGDLRDPEAAPAWFLRIVTTQCLRVLRRRRLKRAIFGRFLRDPAADDAGGDGDGAEVAAGSELGDSGPNAATDHRETVPTVDDVATLVHAAPDMPPAADALVAQQQLVALLRNLEDLPAKQRAALVLRYGHELPVPEVAAMLGVELATAKTHLVRGLARLRDLMEDHR